VVVLFSLSITLSFPLLGAQTVLPRSLYPALRAARLSPTEALRSV